ncbi:MAG: PH domain-containing protein [Candidatus Micrarchaeia archaeon]
MSNRKDREEEFDYLSIELLPGERVAYRAKRGFRAMPFSSWLIITNKRLLMAHKRGPVLSYNSLFYDNISQVAVHKGLLGSRLVISLKSNDKRGIRFARHIQALSAFNILSNQVSMKGDIAMLYNSMGKERNVGMISQIAEEIEGNSMVFAEMIKKTESNALYKSLMRQSAHEASVEHAKIYTSTTPSSTLSESNKSEEGSKYLTESKTLEESKYISVEKLGRIFAGTPGMANGLMHKHLFADIPKRIEIEHKVADAWVVRSESISSIPENESRRSESALPYMEKKGKIDPDRDLLIFKKRNIESRLSKNYK